MFHWTQALWRKVITSYRICNVNMYMTIKVQVTTKFFSAKRNFETHSNRICQFSLVVRGLGLFLG